MKKTILVVDDMPIIRGPIAAMLDAAGYRTLVAANGLEAQNLLLTEKTDLILLDVMMPVMDGLTFLIQIRSDPSTAKVPVIMLSGEEDRPVIVRAVQIGIQGYVLKSTFSLKDLLARVQGLFKAELAPQSRAQETIAPAKKSAIVATAASASGGPSAAALLSPIMTREACIKRVERVLQGKTLSGAVAQVIAAAGSPHTDAGEIAALIARDAVLSVRILRVANSARYRTSHPVTTVSDAVRQIGCAEVRNIAAAIGVFDAIPASNEDGFNPIRCWQHSFAVATLCERLASAGQNSDIVAGHAYLVGLCHDLGEIVFRTQFGSEYQAVLAAQAKTGKPRREIERALLGLTHEDLVLAILKQLRLPDAVRYPIEAFHSGQAVDGADSARLVNLLRLAEYGANAALLASTGDAQVAPVTTSDFRAATGIDRSPKFDWRAFRNEIIAMTTVLARLSAADEAKLMAPPYAPSSRRIWVVRDSRLSEFDPLTAALASMSDDVTVCDKLPVPESLGDDDAVVILSQDMAVPGFTSGGVEGLQGPQAGNQSRILWLSEHISDVDAAGGSIRSRWPIALSRLAEFVSSPAS